MHTLKELVFQYKLKPNNNDDVRLAQWIRIDAFATTGIHYCTLTPRESNPCILVLKDGILYSHVTYVFYSLHWIDTILPKSLYQNCVLFISFRKAISLIKRKFISLSVTDKVMLMDEPTSKMSRIHIANEKCVLYMYFKYCYLLTYISDITLFIVYYNRFVESKEKKLH